MIANLFLQTAHRAQADASRDQYGNPQLGTPTAFACRYQPTAKRFTDKDGTDVQAQGVLYTLEPVSVSDLIFAPDTDTSDPSQARKAISVMTHYDLMTGALHHYSVYV